MIFTDLFFCTVRSVLSLLFVYSLSAPRQKSKLPLAEGIVVLALVFFGVFLLSNTAFQLISLLALAGTGRVILNGHFYRIFALSATALYSLSITEIIIKSLFMTIMGVDFAAVFYGSIMNHVIISALAAAFGGGILYSVYRIFSEEKLEAIREVWLHYSFIITVFLFIAVVFESFYALDGTRTDSSLLVMLVAVSFLIMSLIVINFFAEICSAYRREKQMYALRSDYSAVKEQLAVQFQTSRRLRKIRHDIKNHLIGAAALIDKGEADKARELLEEISESADKLQPVLKETTGNSLIDAVIAYKVAVCESKDIRFVYSLELLPELEIELSDISSVLSNLLDNAIEAAEKAATASVEVRVFAYKNYITVIVKNTFSQLYRKNSGRLYSQKSDSDSHGLGIEIISEICERNGGIYSYRTSGIWFIASALMKI